MVPLRVPVAVLAGVALMVGTLAPAAVSADYPPSPTPTATATPAPTPTPTPTPTPVPTPTPTATPLPTPPPPGEAVITVGGQPVQFTVTENRREGTVEVSGGELEVTVDPKAPNGTNLSADAAGTLIVNSGGDVNSNGRGFAPGTPVNFYLVKGNVATFLGFLDVLSDGSFAGAVPVPADLAPGTYTLQVNGLTDETRFRALVLRVISINLLVKVTEPKNPNPRTVRTVVFFDVYSAKLTNSAKRQLDVAVSRLRDKQRSRVRVVGYVGPGGTAAHIFRLSTARAVSVAAYLRRQGVEGTYTLKVGGNSRVNSPSARRADVIIASRGN